MNEKNVDYETLMDSLLNNYLKSNEKRFLVLIGGCSRSGKTTLANKIKIDCDKKNIKCVTVSLDNWLLGIDERKGDETVRERFKYKDIVEAITRIMNSDMVYTSIYDPKTRLIVCEKGPEPLYIEQGICMVDGVVALDIDELREQADFNIFTDVRDSTRIKRLVAFYNKYKNCSMGNTRKIITSREVDEVSIVKRTQIYADIIYTSGELETDDLDNSIESIMTTGVQHEKN